MPARASRQTAIFLKEAYLRASSGPTGPLPLPRGPRRESRASTRPIPNSDAEMKARRSGRPSSGTGGVIRNPRPLSAEASLIGFLHDCFGVGLYREGKDRIVDQ